MRKHKHSLDESTTQSPFKRLEALQKVANNRSPKHHRRLMASLAHFETASIRAAMPGSTRRGMARGKQVT